MAQNKKGKSAGRPAKRQASHKQAKNGVTKNKKDKKDAKDKKKDTSIYEDEILKIKKKAQEDYNRLTVEDVTLKPATEVPAVGVDEIEVDEEVPRKRETNSRTIADREMWTNPLKFEDLDLHVSHLDDSPNPAQVEAARYYAALKATADQFPEELREEEESAKKETATPPEPFRRKRWINKGPTINDINDVPQDWDENEPDIHPLSYDAQIERCRERIQDNIMPAIFKAKMERFKGLKESHEKAQAARAEKYPGLDFATVTRVESLLEMKELLEKQGTDPFDQMININALIEAYTGGKLKWYGNQFVTYWTRGIQCSQPRGFKMEEFACIRQHFPEKSFWVEGMNGPGSDQCAAGLAQKYVDPPVAMNPEQHANYIRISVRLADGWNYSRMTFMQDTGSTFMTLYENDLHYLQSLDLATARAPGVPFPTIGCHGYVTLRTISGATVVPLTLVCVCLHHEPSGVAMTTWDYIQTVIMPGRRTPGPGAMLDIPRLDGAWLRYKMYRGSAPISLDANTTHVTEVFTTLRNVVPSSGGYVIARVPIGPFGPPPPGPAPDEAFWRNEFPGPSQLEPVGAPLPPGTYTGPAALPPAGVPVAAVGQPRLFALPMAMKDGRGYTPSDPAPAAVAGLPPASFWDP